MKLSERAMLCRLKLSKWGGRIRDREVTAEVSKQKQASDDAGTWWTKLLDKSAMSQVRAAFGAARATWVKMTLPWSDEGFRILPSEMFLDFSQKMREVQDRIHEALDDFFDRYPDLVADARLRLGDLFHEEAFPPLDRLKAKFDIKVMFLPLPESTDFRVHLDDDQVAELRHQFEDNIHETLRDATKDLYRRLQDVVTRMAERLADKDNIFRDSLVINVQEMCDTLERLNIMNDPTLEQLRQEVLAKLADKSPRDLRFDTEERLAVAGKAKDIAAKMEAYI